MNEGTDSGASGAVLGGVESTAFDVGDLTVLALNDGQFTMWREFLTDPWPHDELAGPDGTVRLPIGCFLLPGDKNVLIDAGFGPQERGALRGGRLPTELRAQGFTPADVDVLAISHLHPDHTGWIATPEVEPVFPNAQVVVNRADWEFFVERQEKPLAEHVRTALLDLAESDRVTLLDGESQIHRGVTALSAPGHTPGHTVFAVHDRGERALLLGDAIYCPQQLTNLDWGAIVDVDPALARQTREALLRDLEQPDVLGVGCHFPGLLANRAIVNR
ncbi:MAG: MBL fold metallo-hydrolase [Streptosporangiales bacterium]|nr:MBL fold metallo-hydrolase [Streptosporangiales bacterium]